MVLGVVQAVFISLVLLGAECYGEGPGGRRCPPEASIDQRCQSNDDCLREGRRCVGINETLSVCLLASHAQEEQGAVNSTYVSWRCLLDSDCPPGGYKCCPTRLGLNVCVNHQKHGEEEEEGNDLGGPTNKRYRRQVFGPPSLPWDPPDRHVGVAQPPSLPFRPSLPIRQPCRRCFNPPRPCHFCPMPPPTCVPCHEGQPPPTRPVKLPTRAPYVRTTPRPVTLPTRAPWRTRPEVGNDCPPAISAAYRRMECNRDSDCGRSPREKCCPTTAGGRMCIPPVTSPTIRNIVKDGVCPNKSGPWVCSNTCTFDRDCPGDMKCCPGRCERSRICMKPPKW